MIGQVLLGKRTEDKKWTTPAGGAEEGETPETTAIRELFEESGIVARKEFLQKLPTIECANGKLCHVYLYVVNSPVVTTSKLDPDQEVKTWQWFHMDEIPSALQKDSNRFTSVRNGYMRFHGITKSLVESLEKGGKPAQVGETRLFSGKEYKKMGDGNWVPVVHKEEKQIEAMESKKEKSPKQMLMDKLDDKTLVTHAQQHLEDLKGGHLIESKPTRSGKPVFSNVEQALANKYSPEDFREVGNMYYDRAERMSKIIERMDASGQKPEKSLNEIAKINLKLGKQFLNQANHIEERKDKVNKSVVGMVHQDGAEINTASFAIENQASRDEGYWLDYLQEAMSNYEYGDEPKEFPMDRGTLYLVKVDDGMYSGTFKLSSNVEDGVMYDNAKVRIERMTLPSLIQFCIAKEWLNPVEIQPEPATMENVAMKLEAPIMPEPSNIDKKIMILQLLDKLTS